MKPKTGKTPIKVAKGCVFPSVTFMRQLPQEIPGYMVKFCGHMGHKPAQYTNGVTA